jgi:hypothetical protein
MVWQRAVVCRGRGARGAKPAGRQEGSKCATLRPLGAHILEVCGILESELFDRIASFVDFGAHLFVESPAFFAESLCSRACAARFSSSVTLVK